MYTSFIIFNYHVLIAISWVYLMSHLYFVRVCLSRIKNVTALSPSIQVSQSHRNTYFMQTIIIDFPINL